MANQHLVIDGTYQEGGGQILRSSLAFSALTGRPFTIERIRAGRSQPGLKAQHLTAVRLLAELCSAETDGDQMHSTQLTFRPGRLQPGRYKIKVGTAGSVTLLVQAALLPALFAGGPVQLRLSGGTDVRWSPTAAYLEKVVLPYYRYFGNIELSVPNRGFFPKGGGRIDLLVEGHYSGLAEIPREPLELTQNPAVEQIAGLAVAAQQLADKKVAERLARHAGELLKADIDFSHAPSRSPGCSLTLWAQRGPVWVGADCLGEKGKPAERVARECVEMLQQRLAAEAPIEEHLADNLVPILALRGGRIRCQVVSPHTLANCYVCGVFTDQQLEGCLV